ncbi:hypothetical protein B0H13DRAFT_2312712 [Mycena leptocephala]|nr:hypothetical protein B0H13DRAFT_2312712 [Mycena leptocephala]
MWGWDGLSLHTDSKALRVAIIAGVSFASLTIPSFLPPRLLPHSHIQHIFQPNLRNARTTENFFPKIEGSTITLLHLLQNLAASNIHAMLLGPESGTRKYAGARLFGTFGVPLRVYPVFKINFISPAFLHAIHLVPHLARRAGPHRAADTVSEHSDRDEPSYESADICGDF